jgi:predicted metalloprotease
VYFDLDFLTQLQNQFGATGDLAAQYIVAHEYGHHVQNLIGVSDRVRQAEAADPANANRYSIALELQADCFAGAWAHDADQQGQLEQGDLEEALNAAAAVGDDRIQQQTQGQVNPESWTHGSSEQRVGWFRRGYETGDPQSCNTFEEL